MESKTTVAQCDLGPIFSNSTVAHGVLDKFSLFKKCNPFQEKRQLRIVNGANFEKQDNCTLCFGQVLAF